MKKAIIFWALMGFVVNAHSSGLTVGTISDHSGSRKYNEVNAGICLDDGFSELFGIACAYHDSHENPALAAALGRRWLEPIAVDDLHFGVLGGLTYSQSNSLGLGPLLAGLVTYGTDKFSATVMVSPKSDNRAGVRYLTFRYGY